MFFFLFSYLQSSNDDFFFRRVNAYTFIYYQFNRVGYFNVTILFSTIFYKVEKAWEVLKSLRIEEQKLYRLLFTIAVCLLVFFSHIFFLLKLLLKIFFIFLFQFFFSVWIVYIVLWTNIEKKRTRTITYWNDPFNFYEVNNFLFRRQKWMKR